MSDYQKEFEDVIERALVEKTFSLEIIEKIKELRDGFSSSEKRVVSLSDSNEILGKNLMNVTKELTEANVKLASYMGREEQIKKKELEQLTNELKLESANVRLMDVKEMFKIVFRNPVIQESTFRNKTVPIPNGSGYFNNATETETHNTTKKVDDTSQ